MILKEMDSFCGVTTLVMWYLRESELFFGREHSYSEVTQSASALEETCFHWSLKLSREVTTGITPFQDLENPSVSILT